jgi:hypothetical protein
VESPPYLLPNTQGRYVTSGTTTGGSIFRINDNGTRDPYADYFVEPNGTTTIVPDERIASQEFQNNFAQNSEAFRRTIGNSIIQASGGTTTAPTQNSDQQGGSTPVTTPGGTPNSAVNPIMLYYPNDIASTKQDIITFQAHRYESGNRLEGDIFEFQLNPVKYIPLDPVVALPIQSSITDQNSVGWEQDTLNPIEIAAAKYSNNLITSDTTDIGNVAAGGVGGALNLIKNDQRLQQSIRNYIIGQAVGVNNLVSRLEGQVLNPNLELLFQAPQLRPFNFTFRMSPRNSIEAKTVKDIIKFFKKNMAAIKGKDNIFLKAPNVFKIKYLYGPNREIHPAINLIKMCALTNCSVDYTPLGTYATYNDGTMVAYNISLSFQELTPIYDTDYTTFDYGVGPSVSNHPIGA